MIKYQNHYYPEFVNILYESEKSLQKTITERVNLIKQKHYLHQKSWLKNQHKVQDNLQT